MSDATPAVPAAPSTPAPNPGPAPGRWQELSWGNLVSGDVLDLVPRLTLVVALASWGAAPHPLALLALAVLAVDPRLYRHPAPWFAIAAVLAAHNVLLWDRGLDNHRYLINYWCLAIGLSFLSVDPRRCLARNARWLLGGLFAFATGWMFLSGQYHDGTFFHFEILSDPRFKALARWVAGIPADAYAANAEALLHLTGPQSTGEVATLVDTPVVRPMALFLTWYGIAIEATLAVSFLLPGGRWVVRVRDGALLLFAFSVYVLLPVTLFGSTLVILGYTQAEGRPRVRRAYLGALVYLVAMWPVWSWITSYA